MALPTDRAPTGGRDRVWRALSVQPTERSRVVWAGTLFFTVLASASIGLNAADALYFLRFGVETLPWMIMLSGLVVMVVTIGHAAGLATFGVRGWTWSVLGAFAGWLVAERVAIAAGTPGIYPLVWLTGQIVIYVGFTLLWDVAGELADARQAKRLFPLLTSAGIAGAVTGNALTGSLARLLETENLLIVQAAGLGLATLIARVTTAKFFSRRATGEARPLHDLRAGFETTVRVPLFRLTAGVGAALSVLFFLVFFPFSEVAAQSFENEEALAGFLGLFSSVATAATFLVSLLLANRLFTRLGVVAVLGIAAAVYVAGFSVWMVSFGLVTATMFRGVQWVAVNALAGTAFNSLFNVLTGTTRAQTRDFVSAVPVQAGTVIAGALLLLGRDLSHTTRTFVSLGIALTLLLLVLPMRKAYSAALVDAVRHGMSEVFTAPLPGMQKPRHDADSLSALATGLRDKNPGRRRVTATIISEVGGSEALAILRKLLADQDSSVRLEALESLIRLGSDTIASEAAGLLEDPSVRVRRRAIGLLRRDETPASLVTDALNDADVVVRAHAARIIAGNTGRRVIEEMLETADPETVAAALRCVVTEPTLAEVALDSFANHADRRVRAAAAELLGTRTDSASPLRALLDDTSNDVRLAAATALAKVDVEAIHDVLESGSVRAREAALESLVAGPGDTDDFLRGWAARQLDSAARLRRFRMAIGSRNDGASIAGEYLTQVLEQRERVIERWVVIALADDTTRSVLPLVARGAVSGDPQVKSDALEAIESLADRTLARRLVSLMEEPEVYTPVDRLAALQELEADDQPWLRALAARTVFEEVTHDLALTTDRAKGDASAVVRASIPEHEVALTPPTSMTVVDVVLSLQQASLFAHLDPEDLEALADLCSERRSDAGSLVFAEGSTGNEMVVVVDGSAIVRVDDGAGYRTVAEVGQGEPVGELAALRQRPRMAEVIAGPRGLHALVITGSDFLELLAEQPSLATALLATLAERVAGAVDPSGAGGTAPD